MGVSIILFQKSLAFSETPFWSINWLRAVSVVKFGVPLWISKVNLLSEANRWPERKWGCLEIESLFDCLSFIRYPVFFIVVVIFFIEFVTSFTFCFLQLSSSSEISYVRERVSVEMMRRVMFRVIVIVFFLTIAIVWPTWDTHVHVKTMFLER